jgi:aldehyde:ferredoxin oxidoreductase
MLVGERRLNMMRTFNAREGLDRKNDKLPRKFFKPLKGTGPTAGIALDIEEFEEALDHYYKLNGWTQNGIPTREKLQELNLDWAIDYLPTK